MKYYYYLMEPNTKQSGTWEILCCKEHTILKIDRELHSHLYKPISNIELMILVKKESGRIFLLADPVGRDMCPWKEVDLAGKYI